MKHSESNVNSHSEQAGAVGGEAVGGSAAPPAAVSGRADTYLEQYQNAVTQHSQKEVVSSRMVAVSCGCKSRFCERCCVALGIKLKEKLKRALRSFKSVMMLTFTVDPQHFAGPAQAFEHIKAARCLSVTMQALRRAEVLLSDRWFAVIEWQENGWPHWHVLVEADFVPHREVRDAWNVNLRKLGKAAADTRAGFGSVRFSRVKFADPVAAAGYACAYLTKHPKNGYPAWVIEAQTRKVHRYSTSRGFWKSGGVEEPSKDDGQDDPPESGGADGEDAAEESETHRRTIAEQLATCGESMAVMREIEEVDELTGELLMRYEFIRKERVALTEFVRLNPAFVMTGENGRRAEMGDAPPLPPPSPVVSARPFFESLQAASDEARYAEMDDFVHWFAWHSH